MMSANVLTSAAGTMPFPAGVVPSAPELGALTTLAMFPALANALAMPTCAKAVPELEICSESVANPASAYAAATVVTSLICTNGIAPRKLLAAGQGPNTPISPAAVLLPPPASPCSTSRYTCVPGVQV